ncbi:MAG TPA: hypothetical protein DDW50_19685 [Firmicutes bacterium]|nr:hypothetical protein [Bacillota bacterium]
MKWKVIVWVGSFAIIFLFLPSLAMKIGDYIVNAPWQDKSWLFYILIALALILGVRRRLHKRAANQSPPKEEVSLLFIAKERLVKGEISLEEFREIRRELD